MALFPKKMATKHCFYSYIKGTVSALCSNNKRKARNALKSGSPELSYKLLLGKNYHSLSTSYVQKGESDDFEKLLIVFSLAGL